MSDKQTRIISGFTEYKNFFNKSDKEKTELYKEQNKNILEEDKKVARFLGSDEVYLVAIIRNVLHTYDWAQHKRAREQNLTKEEESLDLL